VFEYDAESARVAAELDKYDLTNVLKGFHGKDIYEVVEKIESLRNGKISEAIDRLTIDELVLYLERQYQIGITEEVRTFMWWNKK
jgi:hypothetical protein